ncbi:MAG: GxxExxY protein, partial [Bacteroidota bacterium]
GLLVNFGSKSAKIERVTYFEKPLLLEEDYSRIEAFMWSNDAIYLENVRDCLFTILDIFGLGYDYSIYKMLFQIELAHQNIQFEATTTIPVKLDGQLLRNLVIKLPLVANKILCGITSGQKDLAIHRTAMKNYLQKTKTPIGIITNFQKDKLEIVGIKK